MSPSRLLRADKFYTLVPSRVEHVAVAMSRVVEIFEVSANANDVHPATLKTAISAIIIIIIIGVNSNGAYFVQ